MTLVDKFRSDATRIVKRERAENNGRYDFKKACDLIQNLFERNCVVPASIARSVVFYWRDEYIDHSENVTNEPTEEHIEKLCAFLSFLNNADENEEILSDSDLQEINDAVNDEAETMPMEQLTSLMGKLVERGVV